MKRLWIMALTLCMVFALAACGAGGGKNESGSQETAAPSQSENDSKTEESQTEESQTDALPAGTEALDADTPGADTSDAEESNAPKEAGSKVLVAYFSCTGNTEGIAEKIVEALGADTYEIVPEQPYTDDDLDYNVSWLFFPKMKNSV